MEEKKDIRINIVTFFLILLVIGIIVVIGIFIHELYNNKKIEDEKSIQLQKQLNNFDDKLADNTSKTTNSSKDSDEDDVKYEITVKDEAKAVIKAIKNGKTISKEVEMDAMIDKTGTINIPKVGTVALVSDSGGEYLGVHIYQLINNEIKLLGDIDCGADMVEEATYEVKTKNKEVAVITAKYDNEDITKEFEMSESIDDTSIIDIFDYGKVVLVAESDEEYYSIQVYRLSQDYITGENKEIKKVGSIKLDL